MRQQKILLLENVATQAAGVREQLTQAGFQVAVSRYEADGLKRLAEWGADLVLVSTAHPAGNFVEYCRRARALAAPSSRFVVTSPFGTERLFEYHPGLREIVDGVLPRPYGRDDVIAMLPPPVPEAPAAASGNDAEIGELRAEFQRLLEAKFLEVEELKRRLEVATRRIASLPGLEWLQSENEHLRLAVEEERKKSALTLATEQLKRSEIEVKLDNLLRMKEDFEFRAQNEISDRVREAEEARTQLRELSESSRRTAEELATLKGSLEAALTGKALAEERLHTLEAGLARAAAAQAPPPEDPRLAELEAELSRQREAAAEGQIAFAEQASKAAVLEEALAGERAAREAGAQALAQLQAQREATEERRVALEAELASVRQQCSRAAQLALERQGEAEARTRELVGRVERAEDRGEQLESARAVLEERLSEATAGARSLLERAENAERRCEQVQSARAGLEERLEACAAAQTSAAASAAALLDQRAAEVEKAAREVERLGRELAEADDRARRVAAEAERSRGLAEERERALAAEFQTCRGRAEAATLAVRQLQSEAAERAAREEADRKTATERLETSHRELAERDRQLASLREAATAAEEARRADVQGLETRLHEATAAATAAAGRCEVAEMALAAARESSAARERELRAELEEQQAASRELEARLATQAAAQAGAGPMHDELRRIQELLEEVITRARTEAMDFARRDAELSARLQAALDERRLLQERFDRASAESSERERRSASLLQSAIDRGPAALERVNLPAVVPSEPVPEPPRHPRRLFVLTGDAAALLAALLVGFVLRRAAPPARRETLPEFQRPASSSPAAASSPREVWERWTRSDASGGVLVQATLHSEQELRAEVEADRASGSSDEEARAEFARRLGGFRFPTTYYVRVYVKNLAPGYPAFLDDLPVHFRLRDSGGREVPAFVPSGHERDRRVFSFGSGAPGDLIYEAAATLGFDRAGLSPSAAYLQLVVSDVGTASRRVLTWELE